MGQLDVRQGRVTNFMLICQGMKERDWRENTFCKNVLSEDLKIALLIPYQKYVNLDAAEADADEDDKEELSRSKAEESLDKIQEKIMMDAVQEALNGSTQNKDHGDEDNGDQGANALELEMELKSLFGEENEQAEIINAFDKLLSLPSKEGDLLWYERAPGLIVNVMEHLGMKSREQGSTTEDRKFKSLRQRWFTLDGPKSKQVSAEIKDDSSTNLIERDTVVTLPLKKAKKSDTQQFADYLVMGIYNKYSTMVFE
jgi:hypothetical protein